MGLLPVIQCAIIMVYVVIYVEIWPINRPKTRERYKWMSILDGIVIALMLITAAPIKVSLMVGVVLIKDLIMMFISD